MLKGHISSEAYELVPLGSLKTHPANPRQGDIGAIIESMRVHGFYGAIVAQKGTGFILAGNHRYKAAKALAFDKVPVIWVDVNEEQARRMLLVDNRTSDLASYDDKALLSILQELQASEEALSGTGFDDDALDELYNSLHKPLDLEGEVSAEKEVTLHITCPNCDHHFDHTYAKGKKKKE